MLVRDRISALIDPETEMWELGMTAGRYLSLNGILLLSCDFKAWASSMVTCPVVVLSQGYDPSLN